MSCQLLLPACSYCCSSPRDCIMTECVQNVYVPPAPVPVLGIEIASYPLVASYSHSKSIRSDSLFLIGKAVPFDPNLWIGSATSAYENVSITSGSLYLLGSIVVQPIGTEEMNFLPALREIHWRVHSFGSVRSHDVAAPIPRCDAHSLVPPPLHHCSVPICRCWLAGTMAVRPCFSCLQCPHYIWGKCESLRIHSRALLSKSPVLGCSTQPNSTAVAVSRPLTVMTMLLLITHCLQPPYSFRIGSQGHSLLWHQERYCFILFLTPH